MTRPPRPKYPSDAKNYHDLKRLGFAHTVRLPEELLDIYVNLKRTLKEAAIAAVVQAAEPLVVPDFHHPAAEEHRANAYMGVMEDPVSRQYL
ncbi:hypothetical protein R1sor_013254 [Riccia sorocarpa]|uniref:Uncharacterized protein n=1 Tax=Riccia sorocarpa TaxID=122646 RepID=A0ABD3H9K9_9MARC